MTTTIRNNKHLLSRHYFLTRVLLLVGAAVVAAFTFLVLERVNAPFDSSLSAAIFLVVALIVTSIHLRDYAAYDPISV